MAKGKKDKLDLYIKQGKAYQELLKKTNFQGNQAQIREIGYKISRASKLS
mgnify:CR=1 FL=1